MSLGAGNFVDAAKAHERTVVLAGGESHVLWFRELTNIDVRKWALQRQSNDVDVVAAADAKLVSLSLCEPDGTLSLTFEQACRLKPVVLDRLMKAVLEVNELRAAEGGEGNA